MKPKKTSALQLRMTDAMGRGVKARAAKCSTKAKLCSRAEWVRRAIQNQFDRDARRKE